MNNLVCYPLEVVRGEKSYSIPFIEKDTSKLLQLFYSWKLWIKVSAE